MPNDQIRLDRLIGTEADKERQIACVHFVDRDGVQRSIEMPLEAAHFVVAHLAEAISSDYGERKTKPAAHAMTPLPVESWQTGREPATGDVTLALSVMGNANFWFRFRPMPAHECGLILAKLAEQAGDAKPA